MRVYFAASWGILGSAPFFIMLIDPQIHLLSQTVIDFEMLKLTCKNVDLRPEYVITQYPVSFSTDAKYLLYLTSLSGLSIKEPKTALRNLPYFILRFLSYTIMIACDKNISSEFSRGSKCDLITVEHRDMYLILATGNLSEWLDTIIMNSNKQSDLLLLMDKLILFFEKRGLGDLFFKYKKLPQKDGTFLLEKK